MLCKWFPNQIRWSFHWNRFCLATLNLWIADAKWRCFVVADVECREVQSFSSKCCWKQSCLPHWKADHCRRTAVDGDDASAVASCSVVGWSRESFVFDNCFHYWSCRSSVWAEDVLRVGDVDGRSWISLEILGLHRFRKAGAWVAMGEVLNVYSSRATKLELFNHFTNSDGKKSFLSC